MQPENQQGSTYENHVQSSDMNDKMQQTCQYSDHKEYEIDCKHHEEVLEDSFYDPQAEEKVGFLCQTSQQLTAINDHKKEENYIVCRQHSKKEVR